MSEFFAFLWWLISSTYGALWSIAPVEITILTLAGLCGFGAMFAYPRDVPVSVLRGVAVNRSGP